jgi:hypothetical protein
VSRQPLYRTHFKDTILDTPFQYLAHVNQSVNVSSWDSTSYSISSDSGLCKAWWWIADRSRNMLPPQMSVCLINSCVGRLFGLYFYFEIQRYIFP